MSNQTSWLQSLKIGDKVIVHSVSQNRQLTETIESISPYPRQPETMKIYTEEGGFYWAVDGSGRFGTKHPRRGDHIIAKAYT